MPRLHLEPLDSITEGRPHYVKVAVNTGRPTYLTFSYAVPGDRAISPGEVVHAPFGRQMLQGIVVDGPVDTPGYDPAGVRPLEPPIEGALRVSSDRMYLANWLQKYYHAPPWDAHAVFLPPGAGEKPERLVVRGSAADKVDLPELSERQQLLFSALTNKPQKHDSLKKRLAADLPPRGFDAALRALVRRDFAEQSYRLARPRGRARFVDVARLAIDPDAARRFGNAIEGRRVSRRARAVRELMLARSGLPFDELVKSLRGTAVVESLITDGILKREGDLVRLVLDEDKASVFVRRLSRSQVDHTAISLIERLADLADKGTESYLELRGLSREFGRSARAAVHRLVEAGVVCIEEIPDRRDPLRDLLVVHRSAVELIGAQKNAADLLNSAIDRADGSGFVLHGVTGSGKTEVYLDALRHTVAHGRRGIVLVPEIALTPQTVRRFAERFAGKVGVLHSGLSLGEAFDEWHAIANGEYDVVIGSRSAIFAPQPDLGLIVVDECHEWTYKQSDPAPRYDARTVALERARLSGAAVVYGSATPDAERWLATDRGDLTRIDLPNRIRPVIQPDGSARLWPVEELPTVDIVDMRGARGLFSPQLLSALGETLDREEQAILFLNRRGFAAFLLCSGGHSPVCSSCDVSLSLHHENDGRKRLVCHQCGRTRSVATRCTELTCDRPLRPVSAGTQRVESEVHRYFPKTRIVRWDRDTTRSADQHERNLSLFMDRQADVLVGTQMVAKGLDLPSVTLVGVVLADYSLREGDFRADERTFQLLVQVAGRSGRADRDGRVIIQTLQPNHPAILAARLQDTDRFFEEELSWRAVHSYPPFRRLIRLIFSHPKLAFVAEEANRLASELRRCAPNVSNIEIVGPTIPQVSRLRGRYRLQLLVYGDKPLALLDELQDELPIGWVVDVDPIQLG